MEKHFVKIEQMVQHVQMNVNVSSKDVICHQTCVTVKDEKYKPFPD